MWWNLWVSSFMTWYPFISTLPQSTPGITWILELRRKESFKYSVDPSTEYQDKHLNERFRDHEKFWIYWMLQFQKCPQIEEPKLKLILKLRFVLSQQVFWEIQVFEQKFLHFPLEVFKSRTKALHEQN